jgi:hypothetical protein
LPRPGRALFGDDRNREHFIALLPEMRERFHVWVHAHALMDTHYHLLLGTPQANVSRALQWLNGSYAGWFNRRHDRTGHVFGERFRAVLVENAAWGLEASLSGRGSRTNGVFFRIGRRADMRTRSGKPWLTSKRNPRSCRTPPALCPPQDEDWGRERPLDGTDGHAVA